MNLLSKTNMADRHSRFDVTAINRNRHHMIKTLVGKKLRLQFLRDMYKNLSPIDNIRKQHYPRWFPDRQHKELVSPQDDKSSLKWWKDGLHSLAR